MSKCIFSLGNFDKKLKWIIAFSITQIILNFIDYYYPKEKVHQIMDSYAISIGQMSSLLIPKIFRFEDNIIKKGEICTKKNIKYQGLLWLINLLLYGNIAASSFIVVGSLDTPHNSILCTKEALEIILLTLFTFLFLKYRYYIHHIISLIIFCMFSIIIDLILQNYQKGLIELPLMKIIMDSFSIVLEIINFCYEAYMLNSLYYHFWTLSFSLGLFLFSLNSMTLIVILIIGDPNGEKNFINNFFHYFEIEVGYIILRFFIEFIIYGIFSQILRLLVLENLTPNHMLISYEISKLSNVLIKSTSLNKWFSIIPFILQFMSLMFFLEIFEYNFCNLNKNTKKNIDSTEGSAMLMRESVGSVSSGIEINEGYVIKETQTEQELKLFEAGSPK